MKSEITRCLKIGYTFLLIFCLTPTGSIHAQGKIDKIAAAMTDSLSYLSLTSQQKSQVTGFNKTAATSLGQLMQKAKKDTSMQGGAITKQVMAIMKQRNDALKKMLTPDQAKSYAQHQAQQLAELQTKIMTTQLDLTDAQIPQAYSINLKSTQEMMADMDKLQDASGKLKKFKAAKGLKSDSGAKDKEMKKILSPDQYTKYQKNKEEMQAAMKEKMKAK
jgi:hypothetical protein